MSQHSYDAKLPDGTPVQITAGWDEAMQWLFLDVEGPTDDKRTDEEGYLYSSLGDQNCPKQLWSYFAERLAELELEIPSGMTKAIKFDMAVNAGNGILDWSQYP